MKNLIQTLKNGPHNSFCVITDDISKPPVENYLTKHLNTWKVRINDTVRKSFLKFLKEAGLKHSKSSPSYTLAEKTAFYARENGKHLIVTVDTYLSDRELKALAKALWVMYNTITQNSAYPDAYTYYPLLIGDKHLAERLRECEGMWRYRPYYPELSFKIKIGVWIEDYECWKCKRKIKVLAGIKLQDKFYPITDLNEKAIDFIRENFPEEFNRINIKEAKSSLTGYISNFCPC